MRVQESSILYDSFFEIDSNVIKKAIPILSDKEVEVDFYCSKPIELIKNKPYTITTRHVNKSLFEIDISFKPIYFNVFVAIKCKSQLKANVANSYNVSDKNINIYRLELKKYYNIVNYSINKNNNFKNILKIIIINLIYIIKKIKYKLFDKLNVLFHIKM
jgi:hypothetical protein